MSCPLSHPACGLCLPVDGGGHLLLPRPPRSWVGGHPLWKESASREEDQPEMQCLCSSCSVTTIFVFLFDVLLLPNFRLNLPLTGLWSKSAFVHHVHFLSMLCCFRSNLSLTGLWSSSAFIHHVHFFVNALLLSFQHIINRLMIQACFRSLYTFFVLLSFQPFIDQLMIQFCFRSPCTFIVNALSLSFQYIINWLWFSPTHSFTWGCFRSPRTIFCRCFVAFAPTFYGLTQDSFLTHSLAFTLLSLQHFMDWLRIHSSHIHLLLRCFRWLCICIVNNLHSLASLLSRCNSSTHTRFLAQCISFECDSDEIVWCHNICIGAYKHGRCRMSSCQQAMSNM